MRVVKDSPFEVGHRVWQLRPPAVSLTVVVKGTFSIPENGGACNLAEEQAPCHGELFEDDDPQKALLEDTDLALMKPRGECFLVGTCWPPGERPARLSAVSFRVGNVSKALAVFGDRQWQSSWRGGGASDPMPFESMPLRWSRSFGGAGYAANPAGRGIGEVATEAGMLAMLPNIELPEKLVTSKGDRPPPAGTFAISPVWKARQKLAGTYDTRWRKTRWPWFPEDFDPSFFLASPVDQRIDGYWRGDEEIALQNLHPDKVRIVAALPGRAARVALEIRRSVADGGRAGHPSFEVPAMRLDTIAIDADRLRVTCVWRGLVEIPSESLDEVETLFVADEPIDDRSDDAAIRARFERRLQLEAMEAGAGVSEEPPEDATARASIAPPPVDPITLEIETEVQSRLDAAYRSADLEELTEPTESDAVELPPLAALGAMPPVANAANAALGLARESPDIEDEMEPDELPEVEDDLDSTALPGEPPSQWSRADVEARIASGQGLAGEDLSMLDLTGLSAPGANLAGAILREAVLRGADLRGANLDGAVLASADLVGAWIERATFRGADMFRAVADGVNAEAVVLDGATAERSSWVRARLVRASMRDAQLAGASFAEAAMSESILVAADLSGANLEQCDLRASSLVGASLRHVCGALAVLDECDLTDVRASEGVALPRASMKRARAARSTWTGAVLNGANLSFADFTRADLSGAKLVEATLSAVVLRHARLFGTVLTGAELVRADLLEALLEGADLAHADLRGANLFGAQLWRARTDGARLDLADVARTHLENR